MNFIGNVASRGAEFVIQPVKGVCQGVLAVVATTAGVGATVLSVCTFGTSQRINGWADITNFADDILATPVGGILRGVNLDTEEYLDYSWVYNKTALPIFNEAKKYSKDSGLLLKHGASRVTYAAGALVGVIARIVDFAIGLIATVGAVCLFGQYTKLNNFALNQLAVFGVIDDVARGLRGFVNPQQFIL